MDSRRSVCNRCKLVVDNPQAQRRDGARLDKGGRMGRRAGILVTHGHRRHVGNKCSPPPAYGEARRHGRSLPRLMRPGDCGRRHSPIPTRKPATTLPTRICLTSAYPTDCHSSPPRPHSFVPGINDLIDGIEPTGGRHYPYCKLYAERIVRGRNS